MEWLSIKVVLTEGRGETLRHPPGRLFAAAPNHTFELLARQINAAFARWDISHLHEFQLAGGTRIGPADEDDEEKIDEGRAKLMRLKPGEAFTYVFDLGDMWVHECVVEDKVIDPTEVLGVVPRCPMPFFGWGSIPDQYGRTSM